MTSPLLEVQQICKTFRAGKGLVHAVNNVSFSMQRGEILGLGGESGCGKSTIAKLLMGLLKLSSGSIFFEEREISAWGSSRTLDWRRQMQMVFQHPSASLDPRMTVEEALDEPFVIHRYSAKINERNKRTASLMELVGLSSNLLSSLPSELSGGQKQRVAIARALALEPRLLICDEPFSALDVSVQAQIINLLLKLHRDKDLAYLIISHDLSVLRYLCDKIAIMYLGEIVETGPSEEVFSSPLHPYTRSLASAVLQLDPKKTKRDVPVAFKGDFSLLAALNEGCPYASRCPFATPVCIKEKPVLRSVRPGRKVSCHLLSIMQ